MEVYRFLRLLPVFESLPDEIVRNLANVLIWHELHAGETLFSKGELSGAIYLVHSGRLEVLKNGRLVGWLHPGEIAGEISLLSGNDHMASLKACRDTLVLEGDAGMIMPLLKQHGELALGLARTAIERITAMPVAPSGRPALNIALLPLLAAGTDLDALVTQLAGSLNNLLVVNSRIITAKMGPVSGRGPHNRALITWLSALEAEHGALLYVADDEDTPWTRRCLRQADRILLLADAAADPALRPVEDLLWGNDCVLESRGVELALVETGAHQTPHYEWSALRRLTRFTRLRPGQADGFRLLAERLQALPESIQKLAAHPLFADLSTEELYQVAACFRPRLVRGRTLLCKQGDPADCLYLVEHGRFEVVKETAEGRIRLDDMGPGEIIGEVGVMTESRRAATVRALRDSQVMELGKNDFEQLMQYVPRLLKQFAKVLGRRIAGVPCPPRPRPCCVLTLYPVTAEVAQNPDFTWLAQALEQALAAHGVCLSVSAARVESELGAGMAQRETGQAGVGLVAGWLAAREQEAGFLLLICDGAATPWTQRCFREADRVLIVADSGAAPLPDKQEQALFNSREATVPYALVLLQPENIRYATHTRAWLEPRANLSAHHHVRRGNAEDVARLARLATGYAYGMALAGASTRGISHLGVVRALTERRIPVDTVIGTSAGAIIASMVACGWTWEHAMEQTMWITRNVGPRPWRMTPPLLAMLSGRDLKGCLEHLFGDVRLEDLLIPCAAVAADIRLGEVAELRHGPIWQAVRASASLPAIWPPVREGGRVLVDGGILNNLPADRIYPHCRHGWLFMSDPNPAFAPFQDGLEYGYTLSGWKILLNKWFSRQEKTAYPSLGEVLTHAICIESYQHLTQIEQLAAKERVLLFRANIPSFGHFAVKSTELMRKLEEMTYKIAAQQLDEKGIVTLMALS